MKKLDVLIQLEKINTAKSEWSAELAGFNSGVAASMSRLIHEAAANFMSAEEVAKASGFTTKRVRQMMRDAGLNPKDGKRLLSKKAAEALANNAALMGIEPHEMDLMSPLAYLPMGEQMKRELRANAVSQVTALDLFPETAHNAMANTVYDAMPWEGETYQAAAETIAAAMLDAGWTRG